MKDLIQAIDRLNSTLRRQNHILIEANGLRQHPHFSDSVLKDSKR